MSTSCLVLLVCHGSLSLSAILSLFSHSIVSLILFYSLGLLSELFGSRNVSVFVISFNISVCVSLFLLLY